MAYFDINVAAAPSDGKDAYIAFAQKTGKIFREHGALQVIDTWGDNIPDGQLTDFKKAVALKDGETVAVGWITWPDKATRDAAWAILMDPNGPMSGLEMPFDGKRMIFGSFDAIAES
ncbi:MAG: DUF1428 domain-containing protein [Caulobacterales bacterium]|nr:DUF1428 domain-containing protein [Caulobacterales bacterium]